MKDMDLEKKPVIMMNQLPVEMIKRIFAALDWQSWKTLTQVASFWRAVVYNMSEEFIEIYFPYGSKYPRGIYKTPLKFLLSENELYQDGYQNHLLYSFDSGYKEEFPESERLLLLAALSRKKPLYIGRDEKDRIESYSSFLASDNLDLALVKGLTEKDKKRIIGIAFKYYACSGKLDLIKKCFSNHRCNLTSHDRGSALQGAAKFGQYGVVKRLSAPKLKKVTVQDKRSALSYAVVGGHIEIVMHLLSLPEMMSEDVQGILVEAAANGHLNLMKALLSHMKINKPEYKGYAFVCAAQNDHLPIVNYLLSYERIADFHKSEALFQAAKRGHLKVVERLLSPLAKIAPKDEEEGLAMALLSSLQIGFTPTYLPLRATRENTNTLSFTTFQTFCHLHPPAPDKYTPAR